MHWFEALFRMSPDGGSGLTELLVTLTSALAIGLLLTRRVLPILYSRRPFPKQ
jgi:hypothetical protein